MAKEIRETPILKGKDAARFEEMIKKNESRKVSAQEYQQGKTAYEAFGFANKADQFLSSPERYLARLNPDEPRPDFDCGDSDLNDYFLVDSIEACKDWQR